jgi:hypothetical protein
VAQQLAAKASTEEAVPKELLLMYHPFQAPPKALGEYALVVLWALACVVVCLLCCVRERVCECFVVLRSARLTVLRCRHEDEAPEAAAIDMEVSCAADVPLDFEH